MADTPFNPTADDPGTRRIDPGTTPITTAWPSIGGAGRLVWTDPTTPAPVGPVTSTDQATRS